MPLLDKLFGKREYPQQVQPATIPIKSLVQPQIGQATRPSAHRQDSFMPSAMTNQQTYPYTPQEAELQMPSEPQPTMAATQPQQQQQQQQQQPTISEKPVFAAGADAPIFVKIERYEEVLTELSAIKANLENFKAALSAFESLRDLQAEIIGVIGGIAKEVERSHSKLDKILVEMQAVRERVKAAAYEEKPVEKPATVTDLEERIRRLRQEIANLELAP